MDEPTDALTDTETLALCFSVITELRNQRLWHCLYLTSIKEIF